MRENTSRKENPDPESDALNEVMEFALLGLKARLQACVVLLDRNEPDEARDLLVEIARLSVNRTIQFSSAQRVSRGAEVEGQEQHGLRWGCSGRSV